MYVLVFVCDRKHIFFLAQVEPQNHLVTSGRTAKMRASPVAPGVARAPRPGGVPAAWGIPGQVATVSRLRAVEEGRPNTVTTVANSTSGFSTANGRVLPSMNSSGGFSAGPNASRSGLKAFDPTEVVGEDDASYTFRSSCKQTERALCVYRSL